MNLKTLTGWAAVAFVVWWLVEKPSGAAHLVHNIGVFLTSAGTGQDLMHPAHLILAGPVPWWERDAAAAAALAVILGLTGLLRGARAMVRACAVIGAVDVTAGLALGAPAMIAGGSVIATVAAWCLWYLRGSWGCQ